MLGKKSYIRGGGGALEIWLDGLVLLVELCQVRYNVLDNVGMWQRIDLSLLLRIGRDSA